MCTRDPVRYYQYALRDPRDAPLATFRWLFRPWAELERAGVVAPPPPPAHHAPRLSDSSSSSSSSSLLPSPTPAIRRARPNAATVRTIRPPAAPLSPQSPDRAVMRRAPTPPVARSGRAELETISELESLSEMEGTGELGATRDLGAISELEGISELETVSELEGSAPAPALAELDEACERILPPPLPRTSSRHALTGPPPAPPPPLLPPLDFTVQRTDSPTKLRRRGEEDAGDERRPKSPVRLRDLLSDVSLEWEKIARPGSRSGASPSPNQGPGGSSVGMQGSESPGSRASPIPVERKKLRPMSSLDFLRRTFRKKRRESVLPVEEE